MSTASTILKIQILSAQAAAERMAGHADTARVIEAQLDQLQRAADLSGHGDEAHDAQVRGAEAGIIAVGVP